MDLFPDLFAKVPMVVVAVPAGLLLLDVLYKTVIHDGALPYDSMGDIALAALTFTAVHMFLTAVSPARGSIGAGALGVLFAQWAFWTFCTLLGKRMEKLNDRWRVATYFVGILWFTYTTAGTLAFMP